MKTFTKSKVKKTVKKCSILKVKELLQIRGGDEGVVLPRDKDFD